MLCYAQLGMDADERQIYYYLKPRGREFVPVRDISRRVGGKRRFHHSPDWVMPILLRMAERGILEDDGESRYRLKSIPKKDSKGKVWASQKFAKLLKQSGKDFDHIVTAEDEDEYYEKL